MTSRPDRLTIVFADPLRNRPAAASYQTLIEYAPGKDAENLEPIDTKQLAKLLPGFNAGVFAERDEIQRELTELRRDYDAKVSLLQDASDGLQSAQATIADLQDEIEALRNPPNPFPGADWQGFRASALNSTTIMRMAMSNVGNFMMLLIYLTEMQEDPAAAIKMAGVWNEMENKTPLLPEEIAGINALAEKHGVPLVLNSEGQIG